MSTVGQSKRLDVKPDAPKQPVVQPPVELVTARFTERELFQIRNACRDSDNENALRFLNAALARAEAKS